MSLVSSTWSYTADDFARATSAGEPRTFGLGKGVLIALALALGVGVVATELILRPGEDGLPILAQHLAGIGAVAFLVLAGITLWYGRAASAAGANDALGRLQDQTVIFDDEGVTLRSRWSEARTRWDGFVAAEWHGDDLLLRFRDGSRLFLPARAMPDAGWRGEVAALIERRLTSRA